MKHNERSAYNYAQLVHAILGAARSACLAPRIIRLSLTVKHEPCRRGIPQTHHSRALLMYARRLDRTPGADPVLSLLCRCFEVESYIGLPCAVSEAVERGSESASEHLIALSDPRFESRKRSWRKAISRLLPLGG